MKKLIIFYILSVSVVFASSQNGKASGVNISIESNEKLINVVNSLANKEDMSNEVKKIKKDITKDYKNFSVDFALTYFADDSLDSLQKWGMDGMTTDYLFGSINVALLKNTWNIQISYTGLLARDIDEGGIESRLSNYTGKVGVYYDSPKVDPQLFDIYFKPLKTSYGDIGFGYRSYTFGYNIEAITDQGVNGFTAVDILLPNTNIPSYMPVYDPSIDTTYSIAYYKSETTRYYVTYNLPDMKYIPRGLGFKYEYAKTDRPVAIAPGILVSKPNTIMNNIGFGIKNSENDLQDGFNITNLYITRGQDVSKYYNHVSSQNEIFTTGSLKIESGFAYAIKFKSERVIYTMLEVSETNYDASPTLNSELKFSFGFIY